MIKLEKRKIFSFIFPAFIGTICIAILAVAFLFTMFFKNFYIDAIRNKLKSNAISLNLLLTPKFNNKSELKSFVKSYSERTSIRITIINIDGAVIVDSHKQADYMENHENRPEFIKALSEGANFSERYSATLAKETMYFALPLKINKQIKAVLRTSITFDSIHRVLRQTYIYIFEWSMVIAIMAAIIAFVFSKKMTYPLEKLQINALSLAKGDFKMEEIDTGIEEVYELSSTMCKMSNAIQNYVSEINDEKLKLELILSSMKEGVIAIDQTGYIITINIAAEKIFDVTIDAKNRLISEVIRNHDFIEFTENILKNGITNKRLTIIEAIPKIIDIHGTPLKDFRGKTIGILMVLNDITKVLKLENIRKEFAANVSHELKTPLTAIKGAAETLISAGLKSSVAPKFLKIIDKHAKRLDNLIHDIMDLAKIDRETEENKINKKEERLLNIIKSATNTCVEKTSEKDISFKIDCKKDLYAKIHAGMFTQALINLLDNAIKFTNPHKCIEITVSSTTQFISLQVTNEGPEIPQEHIPRLFERFYRVDNARTRDKGGTGLGLAIVKHIVMAHNGYLSVKSENNKTSFNIHIPTNPDVNILKSSVLNFPAITPSG